MSQAAVKYPTDLCIASEPAEVRRIQEEIERTLKKNHYAENEVFSIKLAVEEALVNAIKHGNQMDRSKKVRVAYRVDIDRFDVQITDEGFGFNPTAVPDPTCEENLERPCGRGIMLMRHYMTFVRYNDQGNSVCMSRIRKTCK